LLRETGAAKDFIQIRPSIIAIQDGPLKCKNPRLIVKGIETITNIGILDDDKYLNALLNKDTVLQSISS
jgi:hypothetical protein